VRSFFTVMLLAAFAADAAAARKRPPKPKPAPAPAPVVEPAPAPEPEPVAAPAEPAPAPAPEPAPAPKPAAPPAAPSDTTEEVVTDFDEEEKKMDAKLAPPAPTMPPVNAPGGPPGRPGKGAPGDVGWKLIVDLLLLHNVGSQALTFYPNHTLAILMLNVTDRVSLQLHIAPDPAFYEIAFAVTPTFLIKVGKMLIPFGTNNFHHIIGGRVDQQSRFLPETWGDYGIGVNHLLIDSKYVTVEYDAYVVNGFGGTMSPVIAAGSLNDNNFGKGLGGRLIIGLPKGIRLIGSAYHSLWNAENNKGALFYAVGGALPVGAINLPVLNRIGLRGEWARGELQFADDNVQQGITQFAVAKAGWYGELTVRLFDIAALRVRFGRMNGDNTANNDDDIETLEPAIVIGSPKLAFIIAYQFTKNPKRSYSPTLPNDVAYAKVFLQY